MQPRRFVVASKGGRCDCSGLGNVGGVFAIKRKVLGRVRLRYLALGFIVLYFMCDYTGVLVHPWELNYHSEFRYPLEGDIQVRINIEWKLITALSKTDLLFDLLEVFLVSFFSACVQFG